jgi:hypothetical protein
MVISDTFRSNLLEYLDDMRSRAETENGDWTVKGFIDLYQRIYTISADTKVLSKVLELLLFPVIDRFAQENHFRIELAKVQNQYPDITLISTEDTRQCYAIDVKTTYRTRKDKNGLMRVNGMTLGTFQGYFRVRDKAVGSTLPYNQYLKHYVLGVVYSRVPGIDERKIYSIHDLAQIPSVARDFQFFLHEKYRIASDQPGSGNTKNIGSTRYLDWLINGTGVFADLGVEVFNDYWMNYRTRAMSEKDGFDKPPYTNLLTYKKYKEQGAQILDIPEQILRTEADTTEDEISEEDEE